MDRVFSSRMVSSLFDALTLPVQDWLAAHPLVYWLVTHPLWLLGGVLLVILLLAGLMGAIARLTENLWLGLLRSPFNLGRWLWNLALSLLPKAARPPAVSTEDTTSPQQRLTDLMTQMESLQRQQEEILQEVKILLHQSTQPLNKR